MTEYGRWRSLIDGAGAIPDSVVDNFEEIFYEDLGKTVDDYYGGSASITRQTSSNVLQGSYSAQIDTPDTNGYSIMSAYGSGLPRYPGRGDRFRGSIYTKGASYINLVTCLADDSGSSIFDTTGYRLLYDVPNNDVSLSKLDGTSIASGSASLSSNQYLDYEIYPKTDGTVEAAIYDVISDNVTPSSSLVTLSGTDDTLNDNGFGIDFNSRGSNTVWYVDNLRVIE